MAVPADLTSIFSENWETAAMNGWIVTNFGMAAPICAPANDFAHGGTWSLQMSGNAPGLAASLYCRHFTDDYFSYCLVDYWWYYNIRAGTSNIIAGIYDTAGNRVIYDDEAISGLVGLYHNGLLVIATLSFGMGAWHHVQFEVDRILNQSSLWLDGVFKGNAANPPLVDLHSFAIAIGAQAGGNFDTRTDDIQISTDFLGAHKKKRKWLM